MSFPTPESSSSPSLSKRKYGFLVGAVVLLVVGVSVPLATRKKNSSAVAGTRGFEAQTNPSASPTLAPFREELVASPTRSPLREPPVPKEQDDQAITAGNPGGERCCPDNYTGFQPYDECTMYFRCVAGQVEGVTNKCPAGALFSVEKQNCSVDMVTCPKVTDGSSCGSSKEQDDIATAFSEQESNKENEQDELSTPTGAFPRCCPNFYTGYRPLDGCNSYYRCVGGRVDLRDGAIYQCPGGTKFDESQQACRSEGVENCHVDLCNANGQ